MLIGIVLVGCGEGNVLRVAYRTCIEASIILGSVQAESGWRCGRIQADGEGADRRQLRDWRLPRHLKRTVWWCGGCEIRCGYKFHASTEAAEFARPQYYCTYY